MAKETPPAKPVPAATVMVIRDGEEGLEVFMVVRHHQIEFASGALVFPGGKTDAQDESPGLVDRCDGLDSAQAVYQIAAVREAFEECGVLLARRNGQQSLVSGGEMVDLDPWRDRIHKGDTSLQQFLDQEGLRLACDQLVQFAHWITPPVLPKRFDTRFYLAAAPVDQLLVHDGHESVDSIWITADDAIKGAKDGTYTIVFPTLCNLQKLGRSSSVGEALTAAKETPIVEVLPKREKREDGTYLVIPREAGYPVNEIRMPDRMGPPKVS